MTEEQLRLRGRLTALEYRIIHLYDRLNRATGASPAQVRADLDRIRWSLAHATFPAEDPAVSDLLAAEAQASAHQLLSALETLSQGG